ncbi:hypothetical protein AC579_7815 [Pseudocercospora musae]|uniref:Uncharacterized protein n=1 Tax=Pseudocercospora musae TaxID=113226 RepID=A0A139IJG3_9PEZI|nr:hypothetical protein AC579_7815 [Pseudocercospora musae]
MSAIAVIAVIAAGEPSAAESPCEEAGSPRLLSRYGVPEEGDDHVSKKESVESSRRKLGRGSRLAMLGPANGPRSREGQLRKLAWTVSA